MHHPQPEKRFVILSDDQKTLASAILMEQKGQQKVFELTSKPICDLSALPAINILSINSENFMAWRGRVAGIQNTCLYFVAEEHIGPNLRRHLRIPIMLRTYLYPLSGDSARLPVITHDVSCGGISLYASRPLAPGFRFEIAIPFSSPPLLLSAQVIRVISEEQQLYACAFSDLLPQEEALLQEGIFEYDLHHKIKTVH